MTWVVMWGILLSVDGTSVRNRWEGMDRTQKVAELRSRMFSVAGSMALVEQEAVPEISRLSGENVVDVGMPWSLPRRRVTEMSKCPPFVVELMNHAAGAGERVAVVGWPELSLAGIEHVSYVVSVPEVGRIRWVCSACLWRGWTWWFIVRGCRAH